MVRIIIILLTLIGAAQAALPMHHILWYPASNKYDIGMVHIRIESQSQWAPEFVELVGSVDFYDRQGIDQFFARYWLNDSDPNGPKLNYRHLSTRAKYHIATEVISPPVVEEPASVDPNSMSFRIAATTEPGGVYHLPSCRYVTDTARLIGVSKVDQYRPCQKCKPDEIESLLAEWLPKNYAGKDND